MTKQEQRFHAALSLLERVYPIARGDITFDEIASECVEMADALLAELDRAAPKDEPQPDADGWIPHVPGDPIPELPYRFSIKDRDCNVYRGLTRGDCDCKWWSANYHNPIIAWKPAK
jgi:hypothetical protein